MFWTKTNPEPEATTDLGDKRPVMVRRNSSVRSDDGGSGTVVLVGGGGAGLATMGLLDKAGVCLRWSEA
jgi:hypothetical protein